MSDKKRWPAKKAKRWYRELPWLVGCNFIPSTAINQLEMWQAETFDPETIGRELGWAAGIGFNSDVITFHNYEPADHLAQQIAELGQYGRPLICTEWMARTRGSLVETNLPIFYQESVGCINWGLVAGKTNTIWQWGTEEGAPEPDLWFHDLFRRDGTPYSEKEIALFRKLTKT